MYRYAKNSPLVMNDPTGTSDEEVKFHSELPVLDDNNIFGNEINRIRMDDLSSSLPGPGGIRSAGRRLAGESFKVVGGPQVLNRAVNALKNVKSTLGKSGTLEHGDVGAFSALKDRAAKVAGSLHRHHVPQRANDVARFGQSGPAVALNKGTHISLNNQRIGPLDKIFPQMLNDLRKAGAGLQINKDLVKQAQRTPGLLKDILKRTF